MNGETTAHTLLSPVAECMACRHSYGDHTGLRCILFKCPAELPCARFEKEPGSDVEEFISLHEGRGD